ncbi:cadherin EGF LAG seven-pass G-type receptor 1 [Puma concolor]|uniref:Cadherin EGF LAG seven-pass G-type receptor 1 n=1 Tax=Puma concolor TaxID=9696 RepID=A0A6P6I2N1_PUMCO|nr:cadherin EGF LAG seven-pass G-type receptor 1 [Puma concolor]
MTVELENRGPGRGGGERGAVTLTKRPQVAPRSPAAALREEPEALPAVRNPGRAIRPPPGHLRTPLSPPGSHLRGGIRRPNLPATTPQFPLPSYQVSVPENEPAGTGVIELRAHDPDEGEAGRLSYQMEALFDERSNGYFLIDPATGAVSTARALDRETKDTHVLKVSAVDHGSPRRSAATYLTVTVSDTNDHSPVFEQSEYRERVRENLEVGYEVLTIRATDGDAPSNANMRYRLLEGAGGVFEIDPRSGVVRTRAAVDREEAAAYQLLVEANDQGRNPGPLSATATVHIVVEDENDNYPQFSEKRYVVQVPEDVAVNTPVLRVQASDRDQGQNAAIHYSIVSGNLKGQFYLHSLSGSLDVINPLDFEAIREYTLRIKAQDGGRPPLINSSGLVLVQVLDVNDNAPIFVSSPFQAAVLENVPLGHSVLHIQAVDADAGENARLRYRLVDTASASAGGGAGPGPQDPAAPADFPFQIHNSSGWITVCAELDREEVEHYRFGVEAVDHGSPPMSSSASVSITVLDVNDNDPMFTQPVYELRLNEDAAVGSSVLTLRARDRDANSVITYQLTGGNTRNRFALSSQSGGGLITLALPLDYKQERQYVLAVAASDGTRSHTAQVFINVTDANTHRPVFQSSHYTVSVSEDRPVGTSVAVIGATDEDTGENARITYVLEDPVPQFRIDPDTGTVYTMTELDYEDQAAYTLAITARDNGIPQKSDTTSLEILILDANDNAPRFLRDFYQGSVFEDVPPSTSVLQVSATDRDSGPNGRLLYTFQGGDDGDGDFYIEPTSGVIRTQRRLDRENVAVYNLRALAVDRGSPTPLSASVEVQVSVLDINDNPPVFERDELELFVEENSPVGSVVARIRANDPDEGPNAQIMYQIVEGNVPEVFQLDLLSGDLRALVELDFEVRREYVLVVQATSAPLVSRATVHIRLLDQNDNPPVLPDFHILFNNYVTNKSNSFPTGVIGRIPAHDPDLSDSLNYTFLQGNELRLLLLDPATGELQLSRDLDNNRPLEALMEVSVSGEWPAGLPPGRLEGHEPRGPARGPPGMPGRIWAGPGQLFGDLWPPVGSFSSALPGFPRGRFFPSEDLQEQIYLNRTLLTAVSAQRVLPFDDNICLREPCENYMKCVSVLKFDSSAPFISSTTVLFRPIHPINGLRCRCPPGFTGDSCETEIDLCYSSPCGTHGRCRSREGGYTCECLQDFTGEHCEVNSRSGRCANGVCKNGGTCVNLLIGGFHCVCPPGEFERPYCEVTTRSFPPRSFVTFRGLRQRFHFTVSLAFATQERNALLLYNGRFNEKHDFIALEIVGEQVQLTFSAGEATTTVTPQVPGGVSDGRWHSVQVQYYNKPNIGRLGLPHGPSGEKVAVVTVDDCDTAVAVRFGGLVGNYSCAAQGTQSGSKKSLDLTGPLLLGGVPNLPEDFPVHNRQFVGCMRNLSVDGKNVDMASFIANNGTRAGCDAQRNFCDQMWCQNGGTCVSRWNTYVCECPLRFGGKNCEQVMPHPQRFSGESVVSWSDLDITISVPWYLGLMFRTRKEDGVLMAATAGMASRLRLQILNNHVQFEVSHGPSDVASMRLSRSRVTDGEWHHLLIELKSAKEGKDIKYLAVMTLDYGMDQTAAFSPEKAEPGSPLCLEAHVSSGYATFAGAMRLATVIRFSFRTPATNCRTLTRLTRFRGWSTHLVLAMPALDPILLPPTRGYFGRKCVDVCHLNPCEHVSACVHSPSSPRGYVCECGSSHYGQYCENKIDLPCPKGWWGNPVCGPCHCAVGKGFDPDCNKTNGQCQCKDVVRTGSALLAPDTQAAWEQIQRGEAGAVQLLKRFEAYFGNVARNVRRTYLRPFVVVTANMKGPTVRPAGRKAAPQTAPPGPGTEREAPFRRRKRHPDEPGRFAVALVIIYRTLGQLLPEHYDPDRRSLRIGGTGGWSAKGCELLSRNRTHVVCQCSHTTSFAVLMDVSRREHGEVLPLKIVTYAAVSLSLTALLVAFVLLTLVRTLRSNLHGIHRNLIGALFFSQLVFVIGITQTGNPFLCTVIAIVLHYVYMSTFAWTFVESLHVYHMLTEVRNIDAGPMRFYYVVGWGIPAIITGLAVGLDPQGYGNPDFCWLSLRDTLIWSFAGPIGTVIIVNTVIFVLSAKVACQRKHRYYERKGAVSLLRTAFLLLLLTSATWLLGLLAVNSDALAFHYLFAVFSCLQGLFVLLFHCVLNREVRKHLKGVLAGKKLHPDDSATTRATLLTRSLNCNHTYSEEPNMFRTALGESTASLDSTIRDEGGQKLSVSSGPARGGHGEPDSSFVPRSTKKPHGHDSDSDSELSLDEQSSSYASSRSSDSEDDGVEAEDKWNSARGPVHSTPKAPLTEKSLKSRLREKLAECEQSPAPSRSSSLGSSDGARAPDGAITVKSPRREPGREHLNGVAMNVRAGSAQAAGSDSEWGLLFRCSCPQWDLGVHTFPIQTEV